MCSVFGTLYISLEMNSRVIIDYEIENTRFFCTAKKKLAEGLALRKRAAAEKRESSKGGGRGARPVQSAAGRTHAGADRGFEAAGEGN